jgi:hypothetical protein
MGMWFLVAGLALGAALFTSGMKLDGGLTIDLGGGFNTLEYHGTAPSQINGPLQYLYHTQLDSGAATGRNASQMIEIGNSPNDPVNQTLLTNSLLFIDGKQLGGGASFYFDHFDYNTGRAATNMLGQSAEREYSQHGNEEDWLNYKKDAVIPVLDKAIGFNGGNVGTLPGLWETQWKGRKVKTMKGSNKSGTANASDLR